MFIFSEIQERGEIPLIKLKLKTQRHLEKTGKNIHVVARVGYKIS